MTRPENSTPAGPAVSVWDNPLGLVFKLAAADLKHEWVLTLCLVMAIAAVLSPLLLLFGLKYGTISTLRFRLMEDPRNREIRPLVSRSFSREWLEELGRRPDVAFVVPTTRQLSATVTVRIRGKSERVEVDLIPTRSGDVLLLGNGSRIPQAGECVLSHWTAESLHAKVDDTLVTTASRTRGGTDERAELELRVAGVLSPRGSGLKSIYVPLEVLENVERFKDGQAVPEFGCSGSIPRAYPLFNGVAFVAPQPLAKEEEYALLANSGFSRISRLEAEDLARKTGVRLNTSSPAYLLEALYQPVSDEAITHLENRLRGKGATLFPWVKPIQAELAEPSGKAFGSVALLGAAGREDPETGLAATPLIDANGGEVVSGLLKIMLPETLSISSTVVVVSVRSAESALRFPVSVLPERAKDDGVAFVPMRLAGIIKHAELRNIKFDPSRQGFVLSRRGYAGFRLYAKGLDDVEGLKHHLEAQGIPVSTEAQRIHDVTQLDRHLALIFGLVAVIGVVGCVAALVASLYASIERKRRALAVLRLIGFSVRSLVWWQVIEGVWLAMGGTLLASVCFGAVATAINTIFVRHLQAGEKLCVLSAGHLAVVMAASLLIAVGSSGLAAWRASRVEPAESLREE